MGYDINKDRNLMLQLLIDFNDFLEKEAIKLKDDKDNLQSILTDLLHG